MSNKAIAHLGGDPVFRGIIETTKLRRHTTDGDIYAALLRNIIFQQLSGKAATTIYLRFLRLFKDQYPLPRKVVRLKQEQLAAVGLSRQKSNYIQNVAMYWMDNQLQTICWKRMTDDDVIEQLVQIKGVGTWTVQMILMSTLKRPDIFPINDLGIRKAMIKRYRLRSKGKLLDQRLLKIADSWRPHRTLACRYLWRWLDEQPKK